MRPGKKFLSNTEWLLIVDIKINSAYTDYDFEVVHYGRVLLKKNSRNIVFNARMLRLRVFFYYMLAEEKRWILE